MTGHQLERAWQKFFRSSCTYESVVGQTANIDGLEEGVDIFLPPDLRIFLECGMLQVKPNFMSGVNFLEDGYRRFRCIIPVVIGDPPGEHPIFYPALNKFLRPHTAQEVLSELSYHGWYMTQGCDAFDQALKYGGINRLDMLTKRIIEERLEFRKQRPAWALRLE